jgi:hypothetical protein
VTLLLVGFWCFATAHCGLEQLPGFKFLSCCEHPGLAPHQDNDCRQDECSVVESGFYRADEPVAIAPEPLLLAALLLPQFEPASRVESPAIPLRSYVPSELAAAWHFWFRTALAPRAPSFLA